MNTHATSFGLTRGRLWLVQAFLVLLLVGSCFDILTGREHWPLSPYDMYSHAHHQGPFKHLRVYGVLADGSGEIALYEKHLLAPFDPARLYAALFRLGNRPDHPRLLRQALTNLFACYEERRQAGEHDGPALRGLRLYHLTWDFDPLASNFPHPEERKLLCEVLNTEVSAVDAHPR